MRFEFNHEVNINLSSLSGRGKIKGVSGEKPIAGCIYIVEVTESNSEIPNETYPYTHIVVPEIYLTSVGVVITSEQQQDSSHWECLLCDVSGAPRKRSNEERTACSRRCSTCGKYVCPVCGGSLGSDIGSNEDVKACGGGCVTCGWEHCGNCI